MNTMQITIHPKLGAFLQIARHQWGAPLNPEHSEPWFKYLAERATKPGNAELRDLPVHLQGQALRIWRTYNPGSVAALFRRCAPDYGPKNDPWGDAMGVYFDVAAWLESREGIRIDGYRPGLGGPVCESDDIAEELDNAGTDQVERLARFCKRLTCRLERAGLDY